MHNFFYRKQKMVSIFVCLVSHAYADVQVFFCKCKVNYNNINTNKY